MISHKTHKCYEQAWVYKDSCFSISLMFSLSRYCKAASKEKKFLKDLVSSGSISRHWKRWKLGILGFMEVLCGSNLLCIQIVLFWSFQLSSGPYVTCCCTMIITLYVCLFAPAKCAHSVATETHTSAQLCSIILVWREREWRRLKLNAFATCTSTYFWIIDVCYECDHRSTMQAASHRRQNVQWQGWFQV